MRFVMSLVSVSVLHGAATPVGASSAFRKPHTIPVEAAVSANGFVFEETRERLDF